MLFVVLCIFSIWKFETKLELISNINVETFSNSIYELFEKVLVRVYSSRKYISKFIKLKLVSWRNKQDFTQFNNNIK